MIDAVQVQFQEIGRRISNLEDTKPAVIAAHVEALRSDVGDLRDEVRSLKRAFYSFALSVTGSALIFALTAFSIWGK